MAGKKLTTRRHFLKSLALGSVFISYWPCHMRMAIASEHTNQHKFDMAVYLFDEKRWYEENVNTYADSIKGAVTDLIVMVYGHYAGGTMGWKSSLIPPISWGAVILGNQLTVLISAMHSRGIRVHAAFNTCRADATRGLFPPHTPGGKFVDVHNPVFQTFISDLVAECAETLPIDGVCLDFIRTDDYTSPRDSAGNIPKNDASIENIVRMVYEKTKAVKPECIVSSTTTPWRDITHPTLSLTGRKAINWANAGIQDIIFGFEYGKPPNLETQNIEGVRALITNGTPFIGMYANYTKDGSGLIIPVTPAQFQEVLDTVSHEETIAIYTGWLLTDEHIALLEEVRGLPPEPTEPTEPSPPEPTEPTEPSPPEPTEPTEPSPPEPEPKPVPPTSPLSIQRKNVGRQRPKGRTPLTREKRSLSELIEAAKKNQLRQQMEGGSRKGRTPLTLEKRSLSELIEAAKKNMKGRR